MDEGMRHEAALRPRGGRAGKSAAAFRTISEVAGELDVAQHVLRFWESKFSQVRPLKRGGGRRYYRPEDVDLLRQIRSLLYDEGYTIKGAQKLLKAQRRPGAESVGHEPPADPAELEVPAFGLDVGEEAELHHDGGGEGIDRDRLLAIRNDLVAARDTLRRVLG
jgi:DNA-binding transcriptional MerR regulator